MVPSLLIKWMEIVTELLQMNWHNMTYKMVLWKEKYCLSEFFLHYPLFNAKVLKAGNHESFNLKHAPETRSRVSTPITTHEGHGEGAEWWKQFDWPTGDTSCHGKQISVHTRELAPETDSCNRFALGACSLVSNQFCYEGAKLGSKSFVVQHIFSLEIVGEDEGALLRERVAGACCGSKLSRVYRP